MKMKLKAFRFSWSILGFFAFKMKNGGIYNVKKWYFNGRVFFSGPLILDFKTLNTLRDVFKTRVDFRHSITVQTLSEP